jgi:hypothetical protein
MLLRLELDTDFSSNYMKRQIDEIISLLNALYEKKLKDDEEEEEIYVQEVGKSKSKMKKKKKKDDDDEVDLLELIQEEINEQESKEESKEEETKQETIQEVVVDDVNILCECGSKFVKRNRARHLKTKMHTEYLHLKNLSL